jgi:DNA-binding response OmpR family regulator
MGNRVLLVDDDPEILSLVQYAVESMGHQVQVCENGRDVIGAIGTFKPELLLLDVMLPGIDGYSLAGQITENPETKNLPIIVLSALEPSRTMFQKFPQVAAFLTKPFNTDDLMEAVKSALAKAK